MEYKFSQKLTKEDYIAFVTNHMRYSLLRPFNLVLFIVSVGYLVISPIVLDTNDFTFMYIGLAIIGLLAVMIVLSRRNAGKQFEKNQDAFDASFTISNDGIIYELKEGKLEKQWIDFFSAYERGDYLYLYVNKNSGIVIVKRDVPEGTINFIKEQITGHVNNKRVKFNKQ